jgi:hypothetical protein
MWTSSDSLNLILRVIGSSDRFGFGLAIRPGNHNVSVGFNLEQSHECTSILGQKRGVVLRVISNDFHQ